jgi:two-component system, sensor histidine kinase and response regulator
MTPENTNNTKNSVLTILVVDDDELNRRMMQVILKREGHQIECVANGLEAFEAVKAKKYDIVLMDLQMPVMDGVDASRQIREWEGEKRHTFIVALTASYMPERGRELYDAGIDNYIAKPFDMQHLRHILQYGVENRKKEQVTAASGPQAQITVTEQVVNYQVGLKRVGGDRGIYKDLLNDFLAELPAKMEALWSLHKNKDMEGLNRAAHNLKGVSANLGALQLSEYARRLEKQVSEGYNEQAESLINDIGIAVAKLRESTKEFHVGLGMTTGNSDQ